MRGQEAADLRRALVELIGEVGPDAGLVVRRLTRTGSRYAAELVDAVADGGADGLAVMVTVPGSEGGATPGPVYHFMYGASGYGGSDGYGA